MIINTELGKVNGVACGESERKKTVYGFHSIPYAKAGRFEKPALIEHYPKGQPINREDTVYFPQHGYPLWANRFMKHHMMRPEFLPLKDTQTEDALVVNVWTDDLAGKQPVTVFIHGGEGSGTVPIYTGDNLAKKGIVSGITSIPFPKVELLREFYRKFREHYRCSPKAWRASQK